MQKEDCFQGKPVGIGVAGIGGPQCLAFTVSETWKT